ncbi:MAG: hypothetical protein HC842_01880 [Cytophagales bacterium]|nr:hypothetical protein [Cytophagales bacterium]
MEFKHPSFLFGLIALAIPILVHLFNFRKTKRIYFSNNILLRKITQSHQTKNRLKHLLVLAARCLALAFLVLAFAQPYWPHQQARFAGDEVLVYVDNSPSMSRELSRGLTAWEAAVDHALSLPGIYPRSTRFRLITNDLNSSIGQGLGAGSWAEQVAELRLGQRSRPFAHLWERIRRGLALTHQGCGHSFRFSAEPVWPHRAGLGATSLFVTRGRPTVCQCCRRFPISGKTHLGQGRAQSAPGYRAQLWQRGHRRYECAAGAGWHRAGQHQLEAGSRAAAYPSL